TVDDGHGGTSTATVSVTIAGANDAPSIVGLTSSNPDVDNKSEDGRVSISGLFSDIDASDAHRVTVDWGDGSAPEQIGVDEGLETFAGEHEYAAGGLYTISVSLDDGNGGTVSATTTAAVQGIGVVDGTLFVIGTNDRDNVYIDNKNVWEGEGHWWQWWKEGDWVEKIRVYGKFGDSHFDELYDPADIVRVHVIVCDGNDDVHVHNGIELPVTVDAGAGHDDVRTGQGDDVVNAGSGNDQVWTGAGNDTVEGGAGNDKIYTDGGHDMVVDLQGANRIWAGSGDDTVATGNGDDVVYTADGHDTIIDSGGDNRIHSGSGNDTVIAGAGDDRIYADGGDDQIDAGDGTNRIWAGSGNDVILTGSGNDWINAGYGDDLIRAGAGNDDVYAGRGNDIAVGGAGDDRLYGERGNDLLIGGLGSDDLNGGRDDDLLIAGEAANEHDNALLAAALEDWISDDLAAALVHLGGIGDDGEFDDLYGGHGADEHISGVGDRTRS
ncbi:MAG: hypothetical protein KDA61_10565, partial [Planctomycetales bacterium]|nr:hypothetical protein [Planctomycetales bacterium]